MAISSRQGLVEGVIHPAEGLALGEIATARDSVAQNARESKLTPGGYLQQHLHFHLPGHVRHRKLLAYYQPAAKRHFSCGGLASRAVDEKGQFLLRPIMKFTLAADHRVVNGVEGANFLKM